MMAKTNKQQAYEWWFDSHNTTVGCSHWLNSTLSELNEKTRKMLRMIEEDADTFSERVEMYYEKRPQLIDMVEDFYRAQRSLVEQIDHLRYHVCSRHCKTSSLASSNKSCDVEDESDDDDDDILSDVFHEEDEVEFASMQMKHEEMLDEVENLKAENVIKEKAIEELKQEVERIRVENETLRNQVVMDEMKRLKEELSVVMAKSEEQYELLKMKDEEKREVIRQLSVAIDLLKGENVFFKKRLVIKGKGKTEFQRL